MSQILHNGNESPRAAPRGRRVPGVQVKCPGCGAPYVAPVINVIDVRQYPELKAALLSGAVNRAACPACGAVATLSVPLVYHDPEKELLLVLAPTELGLSAEQEQRLIGGLVQAVMQSVPAEERKGYFLHPETVLSMQRLVERVLEADGVTAEMLEAQRARVRLVEELVQARADPARLQALIQEHRAELDYAFFGTLVASAQDAELAGDAQAAEQLLALRDQLLQDPQIAGRLPQPLPPDATLDTAIERLLALLDDAQAFPAMVAVNRPVFDYVFFQALTAQLEQARSGGDTARAERLAQLRARLLEETEAQDRAVQAAREQDLRLIDEMLKNPDPRQAIREHLPQVDAFFMSNLAAALERARREGNIERSARLDALRSAILSLLQESMPPELALVNRLLSVETPEERRAALAESSQLVSEELLALVRELTEELEAEGRDGAVQRLQEVRGEIEQALAARATAGPA